MSGLVARIFRPALRTLRQKTFSLTLQKRSRQAKPRYDLPIIFPEFASAFQHEHLALRVSFEPGDKYEVIPPDIKGTNYIDIMLTIHLADK